MQNPRSGEVIELNLLENYEFIEETDVWQIVIHPMNEEYGNRSCKDPEFWHARQAFLSSYHFSEGGDNTTRYKVRRSVRKINGVVKEFLLGFYRRKVVMQLRKFRTKTYRASLVRPSLLFITCFIPWRSNKE